jgi:hypothetical protein
MNLVQANHREGKEMGPGTGQSQEEKRRWNPVQTNYRRRKGDRSQYRPIGMVFNIVNQKIAIYANTVSSDSAHQPEHISTL